MTSLPSQPWLRAVLLGLYVCSAPAVWADTPIVEIFRTPEVEIESLLAEDLATPDRIGAPHRIGYPLETDLSPDRHGTWEELPDGSRRWRLRLISTDARWLVLGFGTFRLRPGAELTVHDTDGAPVLGPFTHRDVRPHGQLWLPPVDGDELLLELKWPADLIGESPRLQLNNISHGYRPIHDPELVDLEPVTPPGKSPTSGACNIDVNCPLGDSWQDQKRGVVRLLINGAFLCSGSLINTTRDDCAPYVLTAAHCVDTAFEAAGTTFYFNYERPSCESGDPTIDQTVSGSTLRATYAPSDFSLLELDSDPPESYNVFFNGWSRTTFAASRSTGIHHPQGDPKKISDNDDPLINGLFFGIDHWRVTDWEEGTTEDGSSGSPLFDQNQRIVGQLNDGTASCASNTWDEYGKLSTSWNGGGNSASRLKDWLDPDNFSFLAVNGIDYTVCLPPAPQIKYLSHVVDDSAGNNDGIVDPGETIELEVTLENVGALDATGVQAVMFEADPLITVTDQVALYPDLLAGQSAPSIHPHFTMDVDPSFVCGDPIELQMNIGASQAPQFWTTSFSVPTGSMVLQEFVCDTSSMPPGEVSPIGAAPFLLGNPGGGNFDLSWSEPVDGGAVDEYLLYAVGLDMIGSSPICAGSLGTGTSTTVSSLDDANMFMVVARNVNGEGSYGYESSGAPRAPANGGICP